MDTGYLIGKILGIILTPFLFILNILIFIALLQFDPSGKDKNETEEHN